MGSTEKVREGLSLFTEGLCELFSDFAKRAGETLRQIVDNWECTEWRKETELLGAYTSGVVEYRVVWLFHHAKTGRKRKKQYGRAQRRMRIAKKRGEV